MIPAYSNTYSRPKVLLNGHFETIYPALFRKINLNTTAQRERIDTPDEDFLDLDWYRKGSKKLLILQHGLEGSSDRPYILGMAKIFLDHGFDVCAWNYRSCSGEMNRTKIFYHSGATYDLETVVNHVQKNYEELYLIGFSLGANLTLKYIGEKKRTNKVKKAVAISAPIDLNSSSYRLLDKSCYIYEKRFLRNLKQKVLDKKYKANFDMDIRVEHIKNLRDFDDSFTAPMHGFENATDYYQQSSSKFFLSTINIPTLILNAQTDVLLTQESLSPKKLDMSSQVSMEVTKHGGHVGFTEFNEQNYYWSEKRALSFCLQ